MANTTAIATSFKTEMLNGIHALGVSVVRSVTTADVLKAALYLATGSQGAGTTAYSATNEVTGTNYTAGGVTVTNANAPAATGTTSFWTPSASFPWPSVTLLTSFDCVTIYNSTQGNKAISSHNFGPQTVSGGNFTLTMPTNDATNGLVRFA